jgi:hypothetical protein
MDKKFDSFKNEMEKIKKESEEKLLKKQAELAALAEEVHSKAQAWNDCIIPYLDAFEYREKNTGALITMTPGMMSFRLPESCVIVGHDTIQFFSSSEKEERINEQYKLLEIMDSILTLYEDSIMAEARRQCYDKCMRAPTTLSL